MSSGEQMAYSTSTSPSHSAMWAMPMPRSSVLRHRLSPTGRRCLAAARSVNITIPVPNSSENRPMNFWSKRISPIPPMAQSSQVLDPPASRLK